MKKLLLSSIIMFAVCGYATAQNATGSKIKQSAAVSPTPQKAAVVAEAVTVDAISDKAPVSAEKAAARAKTNEAKKVETVDADGVVTKEEYKKAEAAKAAAAKKNKQN